MRTIKFRAWDKVRQKMYMWDSVGDGLKDESYGDDWCVFKGLCEKVQEENELMQFTGLLDKNGKEIYEGDVLNMHAFTGSVEYCENFGCFMVNHGKSLGFLSKDNGCYHDEDGIEIEFYASECEIIGNVHEHPINL